MRAMVIYASWFGHNRAIAQQIAAQLEAHGVTTVCAPVSEIAPAELLGCDLLVLGSYTHGHHASRPLHDLLAATPPVRLQRAVVGVFGVRSPDGEADGIDELTLHLEQLGVAAAVRPLRINLPSPDYLPHVWFDADVERRTTQFADGLVAALPLASR
ncbi:MAG: flavodoxin domain-containing protein [Chloroflexi bacterium]|nr:flavodoxin domain-containing protein [Chloroflexota bacterium]